MVRGGIEGIELEGAKEFVLGTLPVPILRRADVGERNMSRGTRVIEQHGEAGAGGCLGPYLHWRENTVVTEELVGIGEAGVGLRTANLRRSIA